MKDRLDRILVRKGMFPSGEKAKAAVMAGIVYVNEERIDKAGTSVDENAKIVVKEALCSYVSRGGLKLEKALQTFQIDLKGAIAVDIGASTGGFTHCMLQHGVAKVFAIDVGYGQLDWKLRNDPKVVNMERINVRYLDVDSVDKDIDFVCIDVSFISLKLIFPVAAKLLAPGGKLVCLVKPQFEAGREQVGKKGIIRDSKIHREVIESVIGYGVEFGLFAKGLTWSPITGANGNIEYLLYFRKGEVKDSEVAKDNRKPVEDVIILNDEKIKLNIEQVVANSHLELKSSKNRGVQT